MSFIVNPIAGLFSGGAKKKASKKAQEAYNAAQEKAMAQSRATQDAQEARLAPWSEKGRIGLNRVAEGISNGYYTRRFGADDFAADPGYDFRKAEGLKALDRTINARGGLFSGAQLRGAQEYGQNIASEEYDRAYNRFNQDRSNDFSRTMSLASLGLGADNAIVDTLAREGNDIRTSLIDIGGNNAGAIRERGAISADMITGVANGINEGLAAFGLSSPTSLLTKLGIGGSSPASGGGGVGRSSGTSLANLSKIFGRG